ncbi:MAG: YibE/F family protein [Thermotogaceae bacterium]|nr:YibE/F family protein [Thermotogaceae bacterium]
MKGRCLRSLRYEFIFFLILLVFNIVLLWIPSPFIKEQFSYTIAKVISVDNEQLFQYGLVKQGFQNINLTILFGKHAGKSFRVPNNLYGRMEIDKLFYPEDVALVEWVSVDEEETIDVHIIDHFRLGVEMFLFAVFGVLLVWYSRWTGLKTLLSFTTTILVIWKIMVPAFLQGYNPVYIAFTIVLSLSAMIIFLVGGFHKKGFVAFLGSVSGVLFTLLLSLAFSKPFKINGAVMSYSESLLYSGFAHLDLNQLFLASIFIGSSGAAMDLGMDISASMHEIIIHHPDVSRRALLISGFNVGRAVVGTMSTTLLFAYSGGFLTVLMAFMAQGIRSVAMLNLNTFSSEVLLILVGSFGLVLTAPLTAMIGALLYKWDTHPFLFSGKKNNLQGRLIESPKKE